MKKLVVFYHGEREAPEAMRLVRAERASGNAAIVRDALAFNGELEMVTQVVVLPNVSKHARALIVGAYRGDLIKLRGSSKWYGGEIKIEGYGQDAETLVIIPEQRQISGPKADPEEVSQAARPDGNLSTTAVVTEPPPPPPRRTKQQPRSKFT